MIVVNGKQVSDRQRKKTQNANDSVDQSVMLTFTEAVNRDVSASSAPTGFKMCLKSFLQNVFKALESTVFVVQCFLEKVNFCA